MPYFLTFQVVGWADVFSRKIYRDFILENLTYCRNAKGLYLFGHVIMTNHLHLVVQQKDGKLSEWGEQSRKTGRPFYSTPDGQGKPVLDLFG